MGITPTYKHLWYLKQDCTETDSVGVTYLNSSGKGKCRCYIFEQQWKKHQEVSTIFLHDKKE